MQIVASVLRLFQLLSVCEMNQSSLLYSFGQECVIFTFARKTGLSDSTVEKKMATGTFSNNS